MMPEVMWEPVAASGAPLAWAAQSAPRRCTFSCEELSLHVVRSFSLRGDCRLNLQTITLLEAGGVEPQMFQDLLEAELQEVRRAHAPNMFQRNRFPHAWINIVHGLENKIRILVHFDNYYMCIYAADLANER